jgi:hypothetical protein
MYGALRQGAIDVKHSGDGHHPGIVNLHATTAIVPKA